jgi:hypothetical protein
MKTPSARSGKTSNPKEPGTENVISTLETIFASDPVPDSTSSRRSREKRLNLMVEFIGDQFTAALETGSASGKGPDSEIRRIIRSVAISLRHFDLPIEDAMTVIDRTCDRIRKEGAIADSVNLSVSESAGNVIYDPTSRALNDLGFQCVQYIIERTKKEIEPLNLPDKVIEVQRRKRKGWMYEPYYEQTHNVILRDVAIEIDLQKQRKKIHDTIQINDPQVDREAKEGKDEYDPTKRGLTRQLAIMLLDELFPNLKDTKPTPKGDFLHLLTGYNAKGLANKWNDYNVGSEDYEVDLQTVDKWKKKLKIKD